ncbi:hypothetical protein AZI86_13920 [Bdellovibrio bacteriovorus]|uniref:Fido domain-containing protein n=1 Tax=Bdellovibrio bacteriovorus TaxID=959 RepID=A0A150WKC8_BDEBC|nr:Fic family protein [Bdellovibrio bacteriovorus]KYG64144.1 hypothetical protein AZI86_13920 [Bdellovibrio bacteriovorus]
MFRKTLGMWIVLLIAATQAQAAVMCDYVFINPTVAARPVGFGLRSESGHITPVELAKFRQTKTELWRTLEKLPAERRKNVEHLLASIEFFDYTHLAAKLVPNFLSGGKESFDFTNLYDSTYAWSEVKGAPFKGFLNARDNFLRKETPKVSADLLLEIHKRAMIDGVEGIKAEQLGLWRNGHWLGNASGQTALSKKEIANIDSNPYLLFEKNPFDYSAGNGPTLLWENVTVWGSLRDMKASVDYSSRTAGYIHYPFVITPKQETIDLIKDSHPQLWQNIQNYRAKYGVNSRGKGPDGLEAAFTKALVEARFARYEKDRAELGEVKIGINENKYIDLIADLQRDLVAIHPVLNGNGRTTRLLMNYLLTKEGLPPVRLVDPFLDVQVSQQEWREYVHKGVVNSAKLQADVLYRVQNGLVVEHSPELIYPGIAATVNISMRKQGSKTTVQNYAKATVDGAQFNAFIKAQMAAHPNLRQELDNNRLQTMSQLNELFMEFYRTKTVRYILEKDGKAEDASLRFVDPDFIQTFGINRSASKERWQAKIDRWYDKEMLVWRGLANKHSQPSNQELLEYFKSPTTHLVSNRVLSAVYRDRKPLLEAIKEDFEFYNQELLNGKIIEMAVDHHRSGPRYGDSYGYSTSKREVVGKAFAMGAMVVGKYGDHTNKEAQNMLQSRINVASYRAIKDVDLGRLKAIDPEFSYIYGRQAEVMGIGGTDADAVMLIQRIDAKGNVIETFLRNTEKPSEILLIEGRYVPSEGPLPPGKIKARYSIL